MLAKLALAPLKPSARNEIFFCATMNSLVRECRSPEISWIMTLLTGATLYGEENQACSKASSQAPEASGMDETTNPRTQGSLARQDTRCGDLEADQANARRVTAEGAPTRIAAWTFLASNLTPSKVPKSYRLFASIGIVPTGIPVGSKALISLCIKLKLPTSRSLLN
jgi:hypothetical protein